MPRSQKLLSECLALHKGLRLADDAGARVHQNPNFILKLGTDLLPSGKVNICVFVLTVVADMRKGVDLMGECRGPPIELGLSPL